MEPFIIENAINTCYIDSLLMGLLYKPSLIDNILNKDLKSSFGIYLQEYIKERYNIWDVSEHYSQHEYNIIIRLYMLEYIKKNEDYLLYRFVL